jgi:outer membrane protein TolC
MAQEPSKAPKGPPLTQDLILAALIRDALQKRPELAQVRTVIRADLERVHQVSTLPDPVVSLGIQNDGFNGIQIGKMESSYLSVTASQTFPWYGKRDLRGEVVAFDARQTEADLKRAQLSVRAEVEREFVDLLLVRDQLGLVGKLEALWLQAEGLARARYEAGDGAQSDILRAQLERGRLKQRRWALVAEDQRRVAVLNRLRGHPLDEAIATDRSLADMPDPALPDAARAFDEAVAKSPELEKSRLVVAQAVRQVDLAKKDYFPDLTVSAGLMPRWGKFDPMWQAGLSFSIPLWSGSKQSSAVTESRLRGAAAESGSETVRRLLGQRVKERIALLGALLESNRLYRSGLLVQSEATVSSTMLQYQVGRVSFAAVLDALNGYVADVNGFYESVAAAQRVDIAQREISLDAVVGSVASGMGSSPAIGAGGMGNRSSSDTGASPAQPDSNAGSESTSRM